MIGGCFFRRRDTTERHDEHERLERRLSHLEDKVARLEANDISHKLEKIMADTASILAKITANNDVLRSVALTVDALKEGQATIAAEIADLKAQIAANQPPDFTAIDAATDEQTALIAGAKDAIGANT